MKIETAFWDDGDVSAADRRPAGRDPALYGGKDEPGTKPSAADVSVVTVARGEDRTAIGCGALRHRDAAEV